MTHKNLDGLIDLSLWHVLQKKHASSSLVSKKSPHQIFSRKVLEFIQQLFEPPPPTRLAVCCGDEARFPEVFALIQHGVAFEWDLDIYVLPSLEKKWLAFIKSLSCVLSIHFSSQLLEEKNYFCVIDCIAPIDESSLDDEYLQMIASVNSKTNLIIALDIPSGLNPNTGYHRQVEVVDANITLCRYAYFQGLYTGVAREYVGAPAILMPEWPMVLDFTSYLLTEEYISSIWPQRQAFAYKGAFKRVKVLAGQKSMFGASVLAAYAALVMGAGWVEVYYQDGIAPPYGELPEIIWHPVSALEEIKQGIEPDDIIIVGPGLGFGDWGQKIWSWVKDLPNTMVVDASALNYLAKENLKRDNWVITPHPGEAAELLGQTPQDIQKNRFNAIQTLQEKYHATVILKGSGTLVLGKKSPILICPLGNAGMATPGMGDVLTGLVAGCLAQMENSFEAASLAVWLHASAGDQVIEQNPAMIVRPKRLIKELQNHMQDFLSSETQ